MTYRIFTQKSIIVIAMIVGAWSSAVAGEILDMQGNRIFYTEETGEKRQVTTSSGQPAVYYELRLVHEPSGTRFEYDAHNEQVLSNGELVVDYNFNKRRWNWVWGSGVSACKDRSGLVVTCAVGKENVARHYARDEKFGDRVFFSSDQGDIPVLTYRDGLYHNEFGEPIYQLKGSIPAWAAIVMVHFHHQQTYTEAAMPLIIERRESSFSLATDMLSLGRKIFETQRTFSITGEGNPIETIYFTQVNGQIEYLTHEQIMRLQNRWLQVNEKTYRRSRPHDIPAGGFYIKKKQAKKMGIPYTKGRYIVIEVRALPEFVAEFRAAIG